MTIPPTLSMELEDDVLVELMVDRPDAERLVGDVYIGQVQAVLPGIQAAFVDIGTEKAAFLHVSDVAPDTSEDEDEEDRDRDRSVQGSPPPETLDEGGGGGAGARLGRGLVGRAQDDRPT